MQQQCKLFFPLKALDSSVPCHMVQWPGPHGNMTWSQREMWRGSFLLAPYGFCGKVMQGQTDQHTFTAQVYIWTSSTLFIQASSATPVLYTAQVLMQTRALLNSVISLNDKPLLQPYKTIRAWNPTIHNKIDPPTSVHNTAPEIFS